MEAPVTIRKVEDRDLLYIGKLHKLSYETDHFTSRFTTKMLADLYGEIVAINKYSYVAIINDKIVAVALAGNRTRESVKKFIKKNWYKLAWTIMRNPSFILKKIGDFFTIFIRKKTTQFAGVRYLNLLVDPQYQGQGIAKKITEELESDLLKDNIRQYGHSVKINNKKTINFHLKNNCVIEHQDAETVYFIKNLA